MFSDTVNYKDWDDNPQTERLWFNITKTDLLSNLALMDRAEAIEKNLKGPKRELTTPEKQEILDVVKAFMKMAYGLKSADGVHFRKSEEIWDDFSSTAAYDEYLVGLFLDDKKAFNFITNVLPKDLREQATAEAQRLAGAPVEVSVSGQTGEVTEVPQPEPAKDTRPQWMIDDRPPTDEEFRVATPAQQLIAFQMKARA